MGQIGCVGIVKNEEAHIAEWLAWQFLIGFDTVFLLDNASTDRTAAVARGLAQRFDVRVFDYPYNKADYQVRAYEQTARAVAGEYEWLAFFDTDEFLRLDGGVSLKTILAARPEAAVAVSWAMFGANGHEEKPDGLVIEAFTRRAPASFEPNRHVKSIIRPALMEAVLSPHAFTMRGDYVDLAGRPVSWGPWPGHLAHDPDYAGGALNHYFTRSAAHWREKLARGYPHWTRTDSEFAAYDRNELSDDRAAKRGPEIKAMLAPREARQVLLPPRPVDDEVISGLRLGIAITTLNRRTLVCAAVETIRALTQTPFELVICDDGSSDGTAEALRAMGITVIGGTNRGIAWNKNRGVYYLQHVMRCDVILLLDDDVLPAAPGWERDWLAAAWRHGHVNLVHPGHRDSVAAGCGTADDPLLASVISGWAYAFSRHALARIGYLDLRFGRYGHEHSDLSFRAVRAGFGGIVTEESGVRRTLFTVLDGGLANVPAASAGTPQELETNARLLAQLGSEPVYRHAWRDDAEMARFLAEIAEAVPGGSRQYLPGQNEYANLQAYRSACGLASPAPARTDNISRHKRATQSSLGQWSFASTREADAAGAVNGVIDGTRKFHTDIEDQPWWQLDLGGIATITEIHIHNTTDHTRERFRDFALQVSIDGEAWVELIEKRDGAVVEAPFIWNGPGTAWARFVRITLLARDFLHLNQVEVFGRLP
ncbi:MAG TPA: glycosyltransferase [Acidocella sp.]|jgi:glycosyltransferase involved in cell wall biosynthesis|nr:glycosyltransferase [Acidocella sp.]